MVPPATTPSPSRRAHVLALAAALLPALLLRLALWGQLPRLGFISDEGEYLSAAHWLAEGHGFAWYLGYLWTRAPLYPLLLALHQRVFADTLTPVFVTQMLLSLLNVALVYDLSRRIAGGWKVPFLSALLMGLFFPFAVYPQLLLSETPYITLLLLATLALSRPLSVRTALLAGVLLGLATLTRSLTLGFLPLVALWVGWVQTADRNPQTSDGRLPSVVRRLRFFGVLLIGAALVVGPWTFYNSRVYGGLVLVDTSGAFNILLGARTASDGQRSDAPPRNFVLALLDTNQTPEQRAALVQDACLTRSGDARLATAVGRETGTRLPQAQVQGLMTAEGLCLIREKPLAFVSKTAGELLDFFQINYSGDERLTDNFTLGRLPRWYALGLWLLDDTLYVFALPLAALGVALLWRTRPVARPLLALFALWWLYTIATAPLLFAINRFRLPLLPFAFICAAAALAHGRDVPALLRTTAGKTAAALGAALWIVATAPYAWLLPRNADGSSAYASYFGPYPSSVVATWQAAANRPNWERATALQQALGAGDAPGAAAILQQGPVEIPRSRGSRVPTATVLAALQRGAQGQIAAGLALLGDTSGDVEASVVRGDLLRSAGETEQARQQFAPTYIDNANPVEWAWRWLHPAPTTSIDLASDLDLGYISGCFLGEGSADGTFRWCGNGTRLRFPAAGNAETQTLVVRADGRGWQGHAAAAPPVSVALNGVAVGAFTPDIGGIGEYRVPLPASAPGADVVITLHTPVFLADAARYVSQQGSQVGQPQQLGIRLDWARLEGATP